MVLACRSLILTFLGGTLITPGVALAAGAKLDKEDRRWLERVDALITPQEAGLFAQIDARDRERFRQIFWARRDPDSRTPHNELEDALQARRSLADRQFRQAGLNGSATDMGRVFLLLGPPSRVAHGRIEGSDKPIEEGCDVCEQDLESAGIMKVGPTGGLEKETYVTWVYGPEPLVGIPGGLSVEFRSQSTLGYRLVRSLEVERALERARRLYICHGMLGYELDAEGRLAPVSAAARHDDELERALLSPSLPMGSVPKATFRATPSFFDAEDEASYVPVQLEIEPEALTWEDGVAEVTVSGCIDATDGEPVDRFVLRAGLGRGVDGRVCFDVPFVLSPGHHELRLAVRDDASATVSALALPLVVPDFRAGPPLMSSVVAYAEAREVAASPPVPGHAFQFGRLRVAPRRGFRPDESLGLLFYVYGLEGVSDAPPVVQYALFHEDRLVARTPESPLPVSGTQGAGNTEIPLETFAPGRYQLRVAVGDQRSGLSLTESVDFEVIATTP